MSSFPIKGQIGTPEGWTLVSIGSAVDSMKNGLYKPADEYGDDGVACLRMYNIDKGKLVWKNIKRMLLSPGEIDEYCLAPGDLLVNRVNSRELVGKAAVFPQGLEPCVYESKNIRVRLLTELVNPEFVNYQLLISGQSYFNYNAQQVVGMASISQPQIAAFPLLLPPRIEQDRIVSRIKGLLAEIERASVHIAKVRNILKRFRQAVLAAACSGKLTEDWRLCNGCPERTADELPETWHLNELGMISDVIDPNPSHRYPPYEGGTVPILATEQFRGLNDWDVSAAKLVNPSFYAERSTAHGFSEDDIIFARKGRLGLARRPPRLERYVFSHTLFIVRTHTDILSDFLLWFLRQDSCVAWLLHEMNANTGVPTLGKSFMEKLPINVPPLDEQLEIVKRIEGLFQFAQRVEEQVQVASNSVKQLNVAILAKAFRGELVPTEAELARREGRDYETAAVLLERIRRQRQEHSLKRDSNRKRKSKRRNVTVS